MRDKDRADHGISPAQLRDTIEAHAKQIELLGEKVEALEAERVRLFNRLDTANQRIDVALKRIELLERDMGDVHPNALSGAKT